MNYSIIASLGPGSSIETIWSSMLAAGATDFRLNTSHLTLDQLDVWLEKLSPFIASLEPRPSLVLDLQGSKWRLGEFTAFELVDGAVVDLLQLASTFRPDVLPVPHADFFKAALAAGGEIALNDAKSCLRVETSGPDWLKARVTRGGLISAHKGITFVASDYRQESLSEKDLDFIAHTRGVGFVRYAVSYLKDAEDAARCRAVLGPAVYFIAKLERRPALDDAPAIAHVADELWLCRGDLGAELGIPAMGAAVHRFSAQVRDYAVPMVMAGQVLEHMTEHPTPTRSEVCHLYDFLSAGYTGLVLSDETAIGAHPVEACRAAALYRDDHS
jgi:pyruvate kinase